MCSAIAAARSPNSRRPAACRRSRRPRLEAQTDIVFSCVPTTEAMNEVVNGPGGLIHSAKPGQIIVELG